MRSSGVLRAAVHLRGIAGIGVQQHELADVVQQARDGQAVAVLVADLGGEPVGRVLGGQRVQAEALGRRVPHARALEEVERAHPAGERLHGLRAEQLDGRDDRVHAPAAALRLVGEAQHGDDQRDVGLDGGDDVGGGDVVLGDDREQPVARLGQRGERLQRFEGDRQAPAVALVLVARRRGGSGAGARPARVRRRIPRARERPFERGALARWRRVSPALASWHAESFGIWSTR